MGAPRKTPLQNIIGFFMTAAPDAVRAAQDAIRGVLEHRADMKPAPPAKRGGGRRKKADQPALPGTGTSE